MSAAIHITGLEAGYGDALILEGIDLSVDHGQILMVVGPSGCGKSTLLKAATGLLRPRAGSIALLGQDIWQAQDAALSRLRLRLGIMFQGGALMNSLSVAENVALPLQMHAGLRPDLVEDIVQARLGLVDLGGAGNRYPGELSGGMRKRAALARALAFEPEILFCDEPGAGLDPITAAEIDRLLLTINQTLGTTIVVVTHELLSIDRLDGRLALLESGRLAFSGSVAQARQSELSAVHSFFNPGHRPA